MEIVKTTTMIEYLPSYLFFAPDQSFAKFATKRIVRNEIHISSNGPCCNNTNYVSPDAPPVLSSSPTSRYGRRTFHWGESAHYSRSQVGIIWWWMMMDKMWSVENVNLFTVQDLNAGQWCWQDKWSWTQIALGMKCENGDKWCKNIEKWWWLPKLV